MSLENVPAAERIHIGFFGMRNAGKSSLMNAVAAQNVSVVSDVKGTTTDPVRKTMELLPLGPVVLIDTPGFDDSGELGGMRVQAALNVLPSVHIAVVVVDALTGLQEADTAFVEKLKEKRIPYLVVKNKADLLPAQASAAAGAPAAGSDELMVSAKTGASPDELTVSAKTGAGIEALKNRLGAFSSVLKREKDERLIVGDLLSPGDCCVLVVPVDASAPKGRLILPQQETLRELLDMHCTALVCQPSELASLIQNQKVPPKLVITDSQAFAEVDKATPPDILLTSFSILFARYKGNLEPLIRGAKALESLRDGDDILISEGCTHHRQCEDIGTFKIPGWISEFTKANVRFHFTSGKEFPEDLSPYKLVVHCGGCMLNELEMQERIKRAEESGVPVVNYGIAIAHMHGILKRSLSPFPDLHI